MKPYRYFKAIAKLGLRGSFLKNIVAFIFVSMLPTLFMLIPEKFQITGYKFLYISIPVIFVIIPCFRMGAIGFLFDSLSKKKTSLGNIFDGFKYFLKLIPLGITKILSVIPLVLAGYYMLNAISPETMELLTEFAENPMENQKLIEAISSQEIVKMYISEIAVITAFVIAIIVTAYTSLTEYIIYNEQMSGFKSLIKSIKLMKGHILYYIGFNLSFILWYLASAFTMGISGVIVAPYKEASFIIFYDYLRFLNGEKNMPEDIEEQNETLEE